MFNQFRLLYGQRSQEGKRREREIAKERSRLEAQRAVDMYTNSMSKHLEDFTFQGGSKKSGGGGGGSGGGVGGVGGGRGGCGGSGVVGSVCGNGGCGGGSDDVDGGGVYDGTNESLILSPLRKEKSIITESIASVDEFHCEVQPVNGFQINVLNSNGEERQEEKEGEQQQHQHWQHQQQRQQLQQKQSESFDEVDGAVRNVAYTYDEPSPISQVIIEDK